MHCPTVFLPSPFHAGGGFGAWFKGCSSWVVFLHAVVIAEYLECLALPLASLWGETNLSHAIDSWLFIGLGYLPTILGPFVLSG